MSNSTSNLDLILQSQSAKEATANALADASSPATAFGRRQSTSSGLTFAYYGATINVDGVSSQVANGSLSLSASTTNYVEATRAGVVSSNATGFTPGRIPLYQVVTGAATVTSYTDWRLLPLSTSIAKKLSFAMSDANIGLNYEQANCTILELTGTLTANRNVQVPLDPQQWTVFNNTAGGFSLQFIGASGTGITVANGARAIIYSDGTNVVRASPDV
jgi:hypothetical protein